MVANEVKSLAKAAGCWAKSAASHKKAVLSGLFMVSSRCGPKSRSGSSLWCDSRTAWVGAGSLHKLYLHLWKEGFHLSLRVFGIAYAIADELEGFQMGEGLQLW